MPPAAERRALATALLLLPAVALLGAFFVYPLGKLISLSLLGPGEPVASYSRLVASSLYLQVLTRTLWVGAAVTALSLLIGYPLAHRLATASPRVKAVLLALILLPFWTNLLVRSYGWMILLNPKGVINQILMGIGATTAPISLVYNLVGVLVGMVQIMVPYMVFPIAAVMSRIDPQLPKAARSLGAGPLGSFLWVYLPMTLPGVMAGVLLVFTLSVGFFVIPAILGGPRDLMIAQLIEYNVNGSLNWGFASALSTVLLAATFALYLAAQRWFGLGALWGALR